jgi:hypothetical protein
LTEKKLHGAGARLEASVKNVFAPFESSYWSVKRQCKGQQNLQNCSCAQLAVWELPGQKARSWLVLVANTACVIVG